jgi:hypothetical protein
MLEESPPGLRAFALLAKAGIRADHPPLRLSAASLKLRARLLHCPIYRMQSPKRLACSFATIGIGLLAQRFLSVMTLPGLILCNLSCGVRTKIFNFDKGLWPIRLKAASFSF